jgi:hypothetical protein
VKDEHALTWVILTPEYPPDAGGVADHSRQVAHLLAAGGQRVLVAARGHGPANDGHDGHDVRVVRFPEGLGIKGLARLAQILKAIAGPLHLLLAHVPTSFGYRGMNLAIPIWLWTGIPPETTVDVLFHEVATPWTRSPLRWNAVAAVNRLAASMLIRRADRIFVSTASWKPALRRLGAGDRTITRLPIMSPLPTQADPRRLLQIRENLLGSQATKLVGHFGTSVGPAAALHTRAFGKVVQLPGVACLFIGKDSKQFAGALERLHPWAVGRIHGAGALEAQDAADHLAACDLALQPYPDGITLRRTSAMAALALGVPTVTNEGRLTEPVWRATEAAVLTQEEQIAETVAHLLEREDQRKAVGEEGRAFYNVHCSPAATLEILQELYRR